MEVYQKNDCQYSAHIFTFFVKINWMNQKLSFYLQENAEPGMPGRAVPVCMVSLVSGDNLSEVQGLDYPSAVQGGGVYLYI